MKSYVTKTLIISLIFSNYIHANAASGIKIEQPTISDALKDRLEIQALIQRVLKWSNSKNSINLIPLIKDKKGKYYSGFDLAEHKQNLRKLKLTNLFAAEFLINYNQIILTLDQRLKKGDYGKWLVGELPSFNFASDTDPWSGCQDVPYDKPNPLDFIEIEILKLESAKGEMNWKWGNLQRDTDPSWKKHRYRFRIVKESNQWKIAYLEGFDIKKCIKSNKQL